MLYPIGGTSTPQKDQIPTVLRLAYDEDHRKGNRDPSDLRIEDENNNAAELALEQEEEEEEDIQQKYARLGIPYESGKMHLPPHWRQSGPSNQFTPLEQENVAVDDDDIPLD